jgi:hypothetical protein
MSKRVLVVLVALLVVAGTFAVLLVRQPKQCDTSMQKLAGMDHCDDAEALAIIQQRTANQNVLNDLDDRLTCTKLKGDMLKAGDGSSHIEHKLAATGYNLDCSLRAK